MISRKIKIYIYLVLFILFSIFLARDKIKNRLFLSPLASFQNQSLKNTVDKSLEGANGTYGIVVKNLKTNENYLLNEHKVFNAGSLYKLWIMAEAFDQIQKGELNDLDVLSSDIADLNDKFNISSESAELTDGEIILSVKDALNQMITISHNYAGLLLTEKIKLSKVASFLEENGFDESKVGINGESPTTTVYDIAKFFEKLYKGELANLEDTQKMIGLLKSQNLNNKLPKYLPGIVSIAHKTGEIDYFSHDGGIVFSPKGDYIIAILSESDYPPGAEERIGRISKVVYDYFHKKLVGFAGAPHDTA